MCQGERTGRRDEATQLDLWLGAVSTDIGIEVLHRHHLPAGTTHRIDPDLDAARDLLMIVLIEAGVVDAVVKRLGIGATSDGRNGGGDPFFTDGDVIIMVLKQVA
ncbi:MAG: LssY C-terminal domain-containing protein [Ktedonobacteraceae bacterium]